MKRLLLLLVLVSACSVGVSTTATKPTHITINPAGLTATQAIITYTAPTSSRCTVLVSETVGPGAPIADVDESKFTGSSSDQRFTILDVGSFKRTFIVGTVPHPGSGLISNLAKDGAFYGRALQPNTLHYYQVTCGSTLFTGNFQTQNIPLGKTYGEPQPIAGAGTYAYPSVFTAAQWASPSPRAYQFRDPTYGTTLQMVTLPGDAPTDFVNKAFAANGTCTNWTTPANLFGSSGYGIYSGTTQDKCAVTVGNTAFVINSALWSDGEQITITGHASVANELVDACLTLDGLTCATGIQQYTLGTADSTLCLPATSICNSSANRPNPWQDGWSYPPLRSNSTTGTALPLTQGISANANFGVLLWKDSTTDANTISIQNVKFAVFTSLNGNWYPGGSERDCGSNSILDGNGVTGFLCVIPHTGQALSLYFIRTDTGEVRNLGFLFIGSIGGVVFNRQPSSFTESFSSTVNNILYYVANDLANKPHAVACTLPASGDPYYNATVAVNANASCTWTDLTPVSPYFTGLLTTFTASDPMPWTSAFSSCNDEGVQTHYLMWTCFQGTQDSPAWVGAFDISTNTMAAAMPAFNPPGTPSMRWSGFHAQTGLGDVNFSVFTGHQATFQPGTTTTLAQAMTVSSTTAVLSSAPTLMPLAVGDMFVINRSECMVINNIAVDGVTLTVTRNLAATYWVCGAVVAHNAGDAVQMYYTNGWYGGGSYAFWWWDFVNDPHGHNPVFAQQDQLSGHSSWTFTVPYGGVSIGETKDWSQCVNHPAASNCPVIPHAQCPATVPFSCAGVVNGQPAFAGVAPTTSGNAFDRHPTGPQQNQASATEQQWGTDIMVLFGDPVSDPVGSLVNVSGSLWTFTANAAWNTSTKIVPTIALSGSRPLLDVSGPTSLIDGTSASNYKYCYAYRAGECVVGSVAHSLYVNAPFLTATSKCSSPAAPWVTGTESEFCFLNYPGYADRIVQLSLISQDATGINTRAIGSAFTPIGFKGGFANAKTTPDGKWLLSSPTWANGRFEAIETRTLPWPAVDGVNRTTFIAIPITAGSVSGTNNAVIEFGYDTNFFCTSRQDICVAHNAAYHGDADPFEYEVGDGPLTSITGVPCVGSCTITVPVIPGHVIYYRWKYRDVNNAVLSTSVVQVAAAF